ncbi:MAG: DUF302 domain-containing protein [Xanthomonadaceae bacterium]|nr:DUF302 domain-containing protein [Xanthomonadaceae bacterium]
MRDLTASFTRSFASYPEVESSSKRHPGRPRISSASFVLIAFDNRDMRYCVILGACNPATAWKAMSREPKIGTMLPCNVIVRELESGKVEVSAVDPRASMQAVENETLGDVAGEVTAQLQKVIDAIGS